ncbi:MAG: dTDP-4-dehydrorhamnose reductase [Bacteroidales bacterium]
MIQKIVVTGANGQLGSEIGAISGVSPHTFIFTDIDTLDLTSEKETLAFLEKHAPGVIINCAAYTAVDKAEDDWDTALKLNADIPSMLGEYCNQSGCKIIHISTDYVFSGDKPIPLSEEDETVPKSIYGQSKLKGEQALAGNKNAAIIRTSWLYSHYGKNFVKSMVGLMAEKEELRVVFDQVGSPTYAGDLAGAIIKMVEAGPSEFTPGIFHYSNEGVASWYDLAVEIADLTGSGCKIVPIETKDYPLPAPRPVYAVLNKEKIKNQFQLTIPHWRSSLKRCIEKIKP